MIHRALVAVVALSTFAGCAAPAAEKRVVLVPKAQLDTCVASKARLERSLNKTRSQIAKLRKGMTSEEAARRAAQQHAKTYGDIVAQLARAFGVGKVAVTDRGGLLVVQIPNTILFDFGKADLNHQGEATVARLAPVLERVHNMTFLVAGNTDNVPVSKKSRTFHSNWELSAERSLAVLNILVKDGVSPYEVAATGFGEFLPVASNDSEQGRAKNRRTEIILMPRIKSDVLSSAESTERQSKNETMSTQGPTAMSEPRAKR